MLDEATAWILIGFVVAISIYVIVGLFYYSDPKHRRKSKKKWKHNYKYI